MKKYILNVIFEGNYHLSLKFDTYEEAVANIDGMLQNGEIKVKWYDINEVEV